MRNWRLPPWLVLLVIVGAVGGWFAYHRLVAHLKRSEAESDSVRILARAQTDEELNAAVGKLGVVFHIGEQDWIAVRYRDYHGTPMWSSAVARDSGGQWFVSDRHFCGLFMMHAESRNEQAVEQGRSPVRELVPIEQSPTLDAARRQLVAIGFETIDGPGR